MSAKIKAKHKITRSLGVNLWGKPNASFNTKPSRPGQHGKAKKRKLSDYGLRLKEKQKVKSYYGMKETQFLTFFKKAYKTSNCIDNFFGSLERRLDVVVYKSKFAASIFAAKQMVKHRHLLVNGKVVNILSYLVKAGDEIEIVDSMKNNPAVVHASTLQHQETPSYYETFSNGKTLFKKIPTFAEVKYPFSINSSLIVEFYSKKL